LDFQKYIQLALFSRDYAIWLNLVYIYNNQVFFANTMNSKANRCEESLRIEEKLRNFRMMFQKIIFRISLKKFQ